MRRTTHREKMIANILATYTDLLHSGATTKPEEFIRERQTAGEDLLHMLRRCWDLWHNRRELLNLPHADRERLYEEFRRTVELGRTEAALRRGIEQGTAEMPVEKRADILLLLLGLARQIWGSTRLVKLLFLVGKEAVLPPTVHDYYAYDAYNFGPFAHQLYKDIEVLSKYQLLEKLKPKPRAISQRRKETQAEIDAIYVLTDKGTKFTQALFRSAKKEHPDFIRALAKIHDKYSRMPLRSLLEYVYRTYPDFAKESQIRDEVLGIEGDQQK